MEAEERKQMREVEGKKLERELEIKLSMHEDEPYIVEMDISDLHSNRPYNMDIPTEYNDKSDKADDASVSGIETNLKI
nr:hypothetical protein BgiMline_019003 [Biomphalaria glabrata]